MWGTGFPWGNRADSIQWGARRGGGRQSANGHLGAILPPSPLTPCEGILISHGLSEF